MRTFFILNSNETFFDYIKLEMEWDNQFLPRVNEHINPSILMKMMSPQKFYDHMTDDAKKEWDEKVEDCKGGNIENPEREVMLEWLLEMDFWIKSIYWGVDANGYYITFYMEETDYTLKKCPLQLCPLK